MAVRRPFRLLSEGPLLILAVAVVGGFAFPLRQMMLGPEARPLLTPERVSRMLLGPEQLICYACFLWASLILLTRFLELRRQNRAFDLVLLPRDEDVRILPEDAKYWERRIARVAEPGGPYLLANLLQVAIHKFGISRSPQETAETVRSQVDVDMGRLVATMATVNYLAWAIPVIGFVGTARGIGLALSSASLTNDASVHEYIDLVTRSLAVSFDTTLVALMLSLLLMFLLQQQQRGEENLMLDCQQYCLERLQARLDATTANTAAESLPAFEPALGD